MTEIKLIFDDGGGIHFEMESDEGINAHEMVYKTVKGVLNAGIDMHDGNLCQCIFNAASEAQADLLKEKGLQPNHLPPFNHN